MNPAFLSFLLCRTEKPARKRKIELRQIVATLAVDPSHCAPGRIEGLVILGEQKEAAELHPLACELVNTGAVAVWSISRFTRTLAGMAAASAQHWKAAEDHFGIAMQQAESFPHLLEQADIYRFYAMMLLDRNAPGDRESGRTFLIEALKTYILIGMPRHMEMVRALMD